MTTKTHYTATATWTPPAWVTKYKAIVAGGKGGNASGGSSGGRGAILATEIRATQPSITVGAGARAGGAAGNGNAGRGGAASVLGSTIAAGGGGQSYSYSEAPGINAGASFTGGDAGQPGLDAPNPTGLHPGIGGKATGNGGSGGYGPNGSGSAGKSNADGGAGGAGASYSNTAAGGGGGGFGGGGGGGSERYNIGAGVGYYQDSGPGAGGSSTGGTWVGYNTGAPYIDIFIAGAPKVPTPIGPTGNAWADRTKPIVLSFQHNSDTPGDALDVQTDAQVQYRLVQTPAVAWTTVTALGTATATAIAANTLTVGQYEWQARTKADGGVGDAQGIWGPWSTSEYFQAATPPATPTISSPASGATIAVATVSPVWSAPGQVEYQARLVGDSAGAADESVIFSDTGTKSGAATTATLAAMTNHVAAHVQVRIRTTVGGLWSAWADVLVSIEWAGPPKPRVTLAVAGIFGHQIFVTVTNPPPVGVEPVADRIEVYVIEGETRERRAILAPGDGWIYETPPSGVDVGVEAVAIYTPTGVQTSSGVIY